MNEPRLLLSPESVTERRAAAAGPLAPLAASLARDLARVREREPDVPRDKARMTRIGGRCPTDGALLGFDPFSPLVHTCPVCGRVYDDEAHHRWWIFWYQLWLAERAVHGAALAVLTDDDAAGAFARDVLAAYAERYLRYPNRDNVLGPTRPFFSTYLESIWLLQICIATDLLEARGETSLGGTVRDRIVEPSRALIASYDEGRSNRQVWNAAALAAAARLLGDDDAFTGAVWGRSGVESHLAGGLLADGTWYEGENYHQFAHRGLWYGVTLAERAGIALPAELLDRFAQGFVAPFLTALPDLTLPARRDSQWAISLRQWRWAESCELGLARRDDTRLAGVLAALYAPDAPAPWRDTGRWRTAAESERNEPPTRLTRADLGWRSLLHARPELPAAEPWMPESVLLPAQGIAVFRRDGGARYAALDYGTSGGGHGHPDRLNLLLADGPRRWLDDMGTGSYVERTLHWYRSTLAHDAPLVDGKSQERVDGVLDAYDERGDWGWALGAAEISPGVRVARALVVGPRYVVDRLVWTADREVTLDLPLHVDADVDAPLAWAAYDAGGAGGLEDGFDFLLDTSAAPLPVGQVVRLHAPGERAIRSSVEPSPDDAGGDRASCRAWVAASHAATLVRAVAPSSPGRSPRRFHAVRQRGAFGGVTTVWDTRGSVADVRVDGDAVVVERLDGGRDEHRAAAVAWRVVQRRGEQVREVTLAGATPRAKGTAEHGVAFVEMPRPPIWLRKPVRFSLGASHYRRSEESWEEAGRPASEVTVTHGSDGLTVDVEVTTPHPTFVKEGTVNPLDNERAEINGHGVQLYVQPALGARPASEIFAWLLVPDDRAGDAVRVVPVTPAAERVRPRARWRRTASGYALTAIVPPEALGPPNVPFGFDLIVNETAPGRERRRGQLVLSGARGEFVYLQGDRHDPERFVHMWWQQPA
ncbi:heparinase II/III domain-containing protein [Gemmatirosa kalamazoonensis]|nr:heparinase II/III family protein [Gemmatirosa kalamazoonensis]